MAVTNGQLLSINTMCFALKVNVAHDFRSHAYHTCGVILFSCIVWMQHTVMVKTAEARRLWVSRHVM